jgi:hypothetical protein
MKKTFLAFLLEEFTAEMDFTECSPADDEGVDAFDDWLNEMDGDRFIRLGQTYAELSYLQGKYDGGKQISDAVTKAVK